MHEGKASFIDTHSVVSSFVICLRCQHTIGLKTSTVLLANQNRFEIAPLKTKFLPLDS